MKIIADSGATKAEWAILEDERSAQVFETPGFNPYFSSTEFIENVIEKDLVPFVYKDSIDEIYLYGAGCSTVAKRSIVEDALSKVFPTASIEVDHDLLGAARALFGRSKGIAAILGTGSNSCLYDGTSIVQNVPSLGYLFGDEGSGAFIGKQFIADYLRGNLSSELTEAFKKEFNLDLENILDSVYNKPHPNRFLASFAKFIGDHIAMEYPDEIVKNSFRAFFDEQVTRYVNYKEYEVGVVGSVGYYMKEIFKEIAAEYGLKVGKVMKSPIEGLIDFHR